MRLQAAWRLPSPGEAQHTSLSSNMQGPGGHRVQCDETSFEVRPSGCKAENLRTFSHEERNRLQQITTDFDRFRKRCANLTDCFEEKGQRPDREVLSRMNSLPLRLTLFHSFPLADAANLRYEPCSFGVGCLLVFWVCWFWFCWWVCFVALGFGGLVSTCCLVRISLYCQLQVTCAYPAHSASTHAKKCLPKTRQFDQDRI